MQRRLGRDVHARSLSLHACGLGLDGHARVQMIERSEQARRPEQRALHAELASCADYLDDPQRAIALRLAGDAPLIRRRKVRAWHDDDHTHTARHSRHSALLHPVRPAVLCCAVRTFGAGCAAGAIRFGTTASARLVPAVGCARLSFGSAGYSTRYGSAEK